jgi:hypothetical protein
MTTLARLRARLALAGCATMALAGCGTMWPSVTATSTSSANAVLGCAAQQAQSLGYRLTRKDFDHEYLEARKITPLGRQHTYDETRRYDVLVVRASGGGSRGTTLEVQARSFSERFTRRGPTVTDEPATPEVRADAQRLADACAL